MGDLVPHNPNDKLDSINTRMWSAMGHIDRERTTGQSYHDWLAEQRAKERRETVLIVVCMLLVVGFLFATIFSIEPHQHYYYKCEDRGGIQASNSNRRGTVMSVICKDGTIHNYHNDEWTPEKRAEALNDRKGAAVND